VEQRMIKRFQKVWFGLAVVAAIVLLGSFLVSSFITRNAVLAQRIEVVAPEVAAILGLPADSKGKTIGSPKKTKMGCSW
jgi:multidrug resistance efflux pump